MGPFLHKAALGIELLDAMEEGIADIEVALHVRVDAGRLVEGLGGLRLFVAFGTDGPKGLAIHREHLDPAIAEFRDIHVPLAIERDGPGFPELTGILALLAAQLAGDVHADDLGRHHLLLDRLDRPDHAGRQAREQEQQQDHLGDLLGALAALLALARGGLPHLLLFLGFSHLASSGGY
jgi:hypothetical protein